MGPPNRLFCVLFLAGIGERELGSVDVGVALNRIGAFPPSRPQQRGQSHAVGDHVLERTHAATPSENPNDGKISESHAGARPQNGGDSAVFRSFFRPYSGIRGRTARSAPIGGGFRLQRRDLGTPASERTSRTRSAGRFRRCLANMCFTCVRIVLSRRPVASATSRTVLPSLRQRITLICGKRSIIFVVGESCNQDECGFHQSADRP